MIGGIMKYFAGLDVSLHETAICIVDEDGTVVSEGKVASEPAELVQWLAATGLTIARLGLEAGPLSPWLHVGLRAAGLPARGLRLLLARKLAGPREPGGVEKWRASEEPR
jgi:transposase